MKVELFCVCDFASADAGGKLNIIGVFDTIHAEETPFTQNLFSVAGRVRFEESEVGPKRFKLTILDSEGKPIVQPLEAAVDVNRAPGETTAIAQIALLLSHIRLPRFGQYRIEMEIENIPAASTVLNVRKPRP